MIFRILAGVALVSLSYYVGREMGRTNPIRERLREKRQKEPYSEAVQEPMPTQKMHSPASDNVSANTHAATHATNKVAPIKSTSQATKKGTIRSK